jgi:hypothetical protein
MKMFPCPVCGKEVDLDNGKEAYDHMQTDKEHEKYYLKCRREVIVDKLRQARMSIANEHKD